MRWTNGNLNLLLSAAAFALLPLGTSCDTLECGEGTFEVDGECVVDDGFDPNDPRCGAGTHLEGGECIPDFDPTICEGGFTVDADGVKHCIGGGGGGDCDVISCGDPGGGNFVSICGQIFDLETNEPVRVDTPTGAACNPMMPTEDGPCALKVVFFDALGFAANPTGTAPQDAERIEINDCGHFKGIKVERPFSGQIAIAFDDATGVMPDKRLLAGIANTFDMGEQRADLRGFAFSKTTNTKWDDSAGNPFAGAGQTFFEKGAYVPVFCSPNCATGDPVEGVKVTKGGAVLAANDWYFDDTDPRMRSSVAPEANQDATGVNGTAIMVNSSLGTHSGQGGDIGTCEWQSELAASVPNALFFRESFTHQPGDPDTDCP